MSLQDVYLIDINMLCTYSVQERDDFVKRDMIEALIL